MDVSATSVVKKIKRDYNDVTEYNQLVDAWNQLCRQATHSVDNDLQFADVEKAAIAALSSAPNDRSEGQIGHDVSRMINSFDYPTFLVTSQGEVAACNLVAWREYQLEVQDSIDSLPFSIEGFESISGLIEKELGTDRESTREPSLIIKRSLAFEGEQEATIAISVSYGETPTALVFVITTKWRPKSVGLLQQQFGLTKTESEILVSFVDGYSSQEIARIRGRSHETVRAQFQSMREKLGARNQTELLRTTLAVSDFTGNIGEITSVVEHPHRRKTENVRAGGRVVEATLMGKFSGDPIVMIAGGSLYTFNAEFEQKLFDANLLVISVCPPSYGSTDTAPEGVLWIDQIAEDVCAVLDQLSIHQCVLLIKHTTALMSYHLANRYSSRISHIVQISTCGPASYDIPDNSNKRSAWVSGMLAACRNNSAIKKILLRGAVKAMVTLGARQFMRLQMSSNPIDGKYALLPENLAEYEYAQEVAVRRGLAGYLKEHELLFEDWTPDIEAVPMRITIIHGSDNKLFSIESVRSIVEKFPEKIELVEIKKAGFTLVQSHPGKVAEILRSIVDANLQPRMIVSDVHVSRASLTH